MDSYDHAPVAVLSSIPSDSHTWNLVFLHLLLEESGFEVVNLGACTPLSLVVGECVERRPDVLVVSTVNGHGNIEGAELIRQVRADARLAGLPAVIGGKLGVHGAGNDRYAPRLREAGYDAVLIADDAVAGLRTFLNQLRTLAPASRDAA
ncbi:cobalamin B12-binding domain-containing protein [Couchioplanes azureus]|uniref:cobalamin B12-binding domain-containing protein n=1 Tax=Couchioplanes caeruleus TaxID=56438 RepID=UPI0016716A45|nr:cobalamin-dependent protein [Couchioplanes caeruleus]